MGQRFKFSMLAISIFFLSACGSDSGGGGGAVADSSGPLSNMSACSQGLSGFLGSCTASQAGGSVCVETYSSTGTIEQIQQQCAIQGGTFSTGGCDSGAVNGCRYSMVVPNFEFSTIQYFYGAGFTNQDVADLCADIDNPDDPESSAQLCN